LKELRIERGYTQKEMADLLSLELGRPISESLYQQWEIGTQNMLPEQVLEIAKWAKIDTKELVEQR
jgi:transcriptional regulator with XRE-family HTH domain